MIRILASTLVLTCALGTSPICADAGATPQPTLQERGAGKTKAAPRGAQRGAQERGAQAAGQERGAQPGGDMPQMEKPTESHRVLRRLEGDWIANMSMQMGPGEPMKAAGKESNKLIGGGLWLSQHYTGELFGSKFEGWGTIGFDAEKEQFVGSWIDSMSSRMSMLEDGVGDKEAMTITFNVQGKNPMTGKPHRERHTHTFVGADRRKFTMEAPMPGKDGEWFTMMEITYTRDKGGAREAGAQKEAGARQR